MSDDMAQPPSAESPHPEPARRHRGRTLTRDMAVVGGIVVVGALWFQWGGDGGVPFETMALTVALAVIVGASMGIGRGIIASAVLAAAVIGGMVLGVVTGGRWDGGFAALGVLILAVGTLIVVPFAWLIGVTIVTMWHGSIGRLVRQALRRGPRR